MFLTNVLLEVSLLSQAWSPKIAIVMVICNVLGVLAATKSQKAGPVSPIGGLTLGQVIGGTCFGHVLGAGTILGLTSIGSL